MLEGGMYSLPYPALCLGDPMGSPQSKLDLTVNQILNPLPKAEELRGLDRQA
jgi:hypothetical protein